MDLATIIGLLLAWGAVVYSMFHASHGHLDSYVKPGELFLVFGGSLGAARRACFPLGAFAFSQQGLPMDLATLFGVLLACGAVPHREQHGPPGQQHTE